MCDSWASPQPPWCIAYAGCNGVAVMYTEHGFFSWYDPAQDPEHLMDGPVWTPNPPSGIGWRFVRSSAPPNLEGMEIGQCPTA